MSDYFEQTLERHLKGAKEAYERVLAQDHNIYLRHRYAGLIEAYQQALDDYRAHVAEMEFSIEQEGLIQRDWENGQL